MNVDVDEDVDEDVNMDEDVAVDNGQLRQCGFPKC